MKTLQIPSSCTAHTMWWQQHNWSILTIHKLSNENISETGDTKTKQQYHTKPTQSCSLVQLNTLLPSRLARDSLIFLLPAQMQQKPLRSLNFLLGSLTTTRRTAAPPAMPISAAQEGGSEEGWGGRCTTQGWEHSTWRRAAQTLTAQLWSQNSAVRASTHMLSDRSSDEQKAYAEH